jgi:hypothetical protein
LRERSASAKRKPGEEDHFPRNRFAEKKEAVNSRSHPSGTSLDTAKSVIVILPVRRLHRGVAVGVLALGRDPVPRHDPRLLKLESLGDRGVEQTAVLATAKP